MTFGLTPEGFRSKRLQDVLADLLANLRSGFGQEIATGADSAFGRLAGIAAKPIAELWELAEDVYASQYPASASGAALDNVLDINGMRRLPEDFSRAWQLLLGEPGTVIPVGSIVSHAQTSAKFATETEETLDLSEPNVAASLEVDGETHGAGETYTVTVDGITEMLTTSGGESDLDVATSLADLIDPSFAITAVNQAARTFSISGDHVDRFGLVGKRLRVTGASGSPSNNGTYTIIGAEFDAGATTVEVAQEIPSADVSGSLRWNCAAVPLVIGADTFIVLFAFEFPAQPFPDGAEDASDFAMDISFTSSIPANLTLENVTRATEVRAVDVGPIEANENSLVVIETPVTGWLGTLNPIAADPGRFMEADVDARRRRQQAVRVGPSSGIDGVINALREVDGVDNVQVFENATDLTDADGRPPHSFEAVVSGGRDEDVARAIFERKAAGITTHGNTIELIVDSQGFSHGVRFSRLVDIEIWVDVAVVALYEEETLPALAAGAIADAIVAHGRTYRGGLDVIPQRVLGAIMAAVPGLQEISVEVGTSPTTGPTAIPIAADEIARFDAARVSVTGL